jgi:CBS domain containing-hemolysin-like protein
MNDTLLIFLALSLTLALDLVAAAVRAAYLEANSARLLALREQPGPRASQVVELVHNPLRLRASLNFALVLTRLLLAGLLIFLLASQPWITPGWVALILLVVGLALFWLEWAVAQIAVLHAENWALSLAPTARAFLAVFSWLVAIPIWVTRKSTGALDPTSTLTEQELKTMVDAAIQEDGALEHDETRMIQSIFQLGETLAREIMVPRIDMLALEADTPIGGAVQALLKSGHSRVPVYDDTVDNMLGLLYSKDLLRVWQEGDKIASLRALLRPAYFVPEAKKVDELLAEMQSQRIHLAIVVDEYGGVAGMVTLEDIVEEIVGEIQDEFDQAEESPYQELGDGDTMFLGRVDLDDFNEVMGSNLPKDEADTLGGYIYSSLGRVPHIGDQVQTGELILTVEQVSARRIRKVRAGWKPATATIGEEKDHVDG